MQQLDRAGQVRIFELLPEEACRRHAKGISDALQLLLLNREAETRRLAVLGASCGQSTISQSMVPQVLFLKSTSDRSRPLLASSDLWRQGENSVPVVLLVLEPQRCRDRVIC